MDGRGDLQSAGAKQGNQARKTERELHEAETPVRTHQEIPTVEREKKKEGKMRREGEEGKEGEKGRKKREKKFLKKNYIRNSYSYIHIYCIYIYTHADFLKRKPI